MWTMIPSLQGTVDCLAPAFTQPSFASNCSVLLAWVMSLGKRSLLRVAENGQPEQLPDHTRRHGFDTTYNFFERSAWSPKDLAYRVCLLAFRLKCLGPLTLVVDDTLTHKQGKNVWGLGWWRDAVASTQKRVATASGHNWVVVALAICLPFTRVPILALPLMARLHLPGKGQSSCPDLAREMLLDVLAWFPNRNFILLGDGAYACKEMLLDFPKQVVFVGRMRGDAALYDPHVPTAPKGKRGRKAKKGPRLAKPKEAAARADKKADGWQWQQVSVSIYGKMRELLVVSYQAVWPRVRGYDPIKVVVVRDPEGRMRDAYLFTTDVAARPEWVIKKFSERWSIEVLFRASKQTLDIEGPQHWCQQSVEKVAPWVWSMQSVLMVWYITEGRTTPEAAELRTRLGDWDSEWSLRHMLSVLRRAILNATINLNSADEPQLRHLLSTLKNWAHLAA